MRWPWECKHCKASLEIVRSSLELQRALEQARDCERLRYDELVKELLAMKREGFVSAPKPQPIPVQKPSPSDEAISLRAGSNGNLRRYLTQWRDGQRALSDAPDENTIAERILRWHDPDEDE